MASSCRLAATIHPVFQRAVREVLTDTIRQTTLAALPFMGVVGRGGVMAGECWMDADWGRADADEGRTDVDVGRVDVDEGGTNVIVDKADDVVDKADDVVGRAAVVVCRAAVEEGVAVVAAVISSIFPECLYK